MAPLVIAHRGDSAHCPENTLSSFASALEVGAEIVEFDVQLTADGHVVVVHDALLDRTTDARGSLRQMTLQQVRAVSAGYPARFGERYRGERIPTLAETLGFLRDRSKAMIELKSDSVTDDAEGGLEALTIEEIRRAGLEKDTVLISFDRRALLRCRAIAPEIMRGHLFARAEPGEVLIGAREVGCELVMPEKGMLSDALRERAREAGLKVATWVVDDPEELVALSRFELYGVGSNRPGVLLEALRDPV
jgi:glycerophosphoryl diester phosphodiesterase